MAEAADIAIADCRRQERVDKVPRLANVLLIIRGLIRPETGSLQPAPALCKALSRDRAAAGHLLPGRLQRGGGAGAQSDATGRTVRMVVLEPEAQGGRWPRVGAGAS